MTTDVNLVLSQLPSCWQRSLTVHLSLNKPKSNQAREAIEQNIQSMQFKCDCEIIFNFFSSLPLR